MEKETMTTERKAVILLDAAREAIEDFAYSYAEKTPELRLALVRMLAGVAIASLINKGGWIVTLRTILGGIKLSTLTRKGDWLF